MRASANIIRTNGGDSAEQSCGHGSAAGRIVGTRSSRRCEQFVSRRSRMTVAARVSTANALFFRASRTGGHLVRGPRAKDGSDLGCFEGQG